MSSASSSYSGYTIWKNAEIITMDPNEPRVDSLVTQEERIVYAGTEEEAERRFGRCSRTSLDNRLNRDGPKPLKNQGGPRDKNDRDVREVDLGGKTVVPGFNDNHVHTVILGEHRSSPSLAGLNEREIVEKVRQYYRDAPKGKLIIGFEWDYPSCPHPHKSLLDPYFPDNPVMLIQYGGHGQWLNSRGLEILGIAKDKPDPKTGNVEREEDGDPTGIISEMPNNRIITRHFKAIHFSREEREKRLSLALDEFRRYGITSVQDNTWFFPTLWSLRRFWKQGRLSCRFSCWPYTLKWWSPPSMRLLPYKEPWYKLGPLKHFLDGSFSTKTAWLWESYADDSESRGSGTDKETVRPQLESLVRKKRQGAFHAIGDRAISEFLDAYEELAARYPGIRELRIRLEHAQLIRKGDIPRLAELGVLVAAQPSALAFPDKDRELLGEERFQKAYPYRSLIDAGVHLSFGSDIPGEASCDPLLSIHLAVNREGGEAISAEEALRSFTAESAYAEFAEDEKGNLSEGKLADFAVLSGNPLDADPAKIKDIEVLRTVVGGREVYRA